MTRSFIRPLAADSYEALIENAITRSDDLYELDGEIISRRRGGIVETGSQDAFDMEVL